MDIDPELDAISNAAVDKTQMLPNGKKRVIFEQTPKMSTYLVFFGVGEFEVVTDDKDPRVRTVTLPAHKHTPVSAWNSDASHCILVKHITASPIP